MKGKTFWQLEKRKEIILKPGVNSVEREALKEELMSVDNAVKVRVVDMVMIVMFGGWRNFTLVKVTF